MSTLETTTAMFASEGSSSGPDAGGSSNSWESQSLGSPSPEVNAGDATPSATNTQAAEVSNAGGATEGQQGQPAPQTTNVPAADASPISAASRQYAQSMGFTEADINAFPSDEALGTAVAALGRRILSAQSTGGQDTNAGQPGQQQQQPPQAPQNAPHPMSNQFKAQLDLGAFDEDTQKVMGGFNDHVANQFGQFYQVAQVMVRQIAEARQAVSALLEQHHLGVMDKYIGGNEDYAAVIGSDAAIRRSLLNDARTIAGQLARTGANPDPEFIFRTAIAARYGDELGKRAKAKVHQDIQAAERNLSNNTAGNGATRKPTSTKGTADPRDQVVAAVKERLGM